MGFLFAVMYVPFLNLLFNTIPLNPVQLGIASAFVLVPIAGSELSKLVLPQNKV
jgi:hypothetical protein